MSSLNLQLSQITNLNLRLFYDIILILFLYDAMRYIIDFVNNRFMAIIVNIVLLQTIIELFSS